MNNIPLCSRVELISEHNTRPIIKCRIFVRGKKAMLKNITSNTVRNIVAGDLNFDINNRL